jgi:small conductance mechanosensitive channel
VNGVLAISTPLYAAAPLDGAATQTLKEVGSTLEVLLPMAIVVAIGVAIGIAMHLYGKRRRAKLGHTEHMAHSLLLFGLIIATLIAATVASPLEHDVRDALLSMYGVVISATIALSSTSLVGNAMAGLMLRGLRKIRLGDFLQVGEHFGRVSERGLLHTEIQTEERNLMTLPNLHLVTNPVTIIREGTVVHADVSLGYDVPRSKIEAALIRAAGVADLADPFVRVTELGDFSVNYRVAGFCTNVKALLSTRSHLRAAMLDMLHDDGIEIVSPTFMNQRRLDATPMIPAKSRRQLTPESTSKSAPDEQIFDKAEEAEAKHAAETAGEEE